MKRLIAVLFALCGLVGVSQAATYFKVFHVGGRYAAAGNNGRAYETAFKDMAACNAHASVVAAGDSSCLIWLWPSGTSSQSGMYGYPHTIWHPEDVTAFNPYGGVATYNLPNPATPATGGQRYHYYSALNIAGRGDSVNHCIKLNGGTLAAREVSIVGCRIIGDLKLENTTTTPAMFDSVNLCTITGQLVFGAGHYNTVFNSTVLGAYIKVYTGVDREANGCKMIGVTAQNLSSGDSGSPALSIGHTQGTNSDSLLISRCNFKVTNPYENGGSKPIAIYNCPYITIEYTNILVQSASSGTSGNEPCLSYVRDSTHHSTWNCDTLVIEAPNCVAEGGFEFHFANSGTDQDNTNSNGTVDSCYFSIDAGSAMFQQAQRDWNFTYNTFVSGGRTAFRLPGCFGYIKFKHNTFVTGSADWPAVYVNGGGDGGSYSAELCDSLVMTDNIFARVGDGICLNRTPATNEEAVSGLVLGPAAVHDLPGFVQDVSLQIDRNLYYVNAGWWTTECWGTRDMLYFIDWWGWAWTVAGDTTVVAWPPSQVGYRHSATEYYDNMDRNSVSGYANFDEGGRDTIPRTNPCKTCPTPDSLFNAHIGIESKARGIGAGGTDAGAVAYRLIPYLRISDTYKTFYHTTETASNPDTAGFVVTNIGADSLRLGIPVVGTGVTASFNRQLSIGRVVAPDSAAYLTVVVANPGIEMATHNITFTTNDQRVKTARVSIHENPITRSGDIRGRIEE